MSDSHGHRAFAFHKVLDDFPMKVDLLIPYGDQLIACCQTALCFLAERTTVDGETQFHYTKSVSKFCRRSVEQLCIMEDTDLLLTLSEGKISCHRLAKLMGQAQQESGEQARYLDEALSRIRQCDMFAVDLKRNGKHRLCAACRKKLVILYWNPEEGAFHEEKVFCVVPILFLLEEDWLHLIPLFISQRHTTHTHTHTHSLSLSLSLSVVGFSLNLSGYDDTPDHRNSRSLTRSEP